MKENNLNLEKFNNLNLEIVNINKEMSRLKEVFEHQKCELDKLIKEILVEDNPMLQEAIIKWTLENPIEAISFYMGIKNDEEEVFFKNDDKYVEILGSDYYDDDCYVIVNKNTMDIKIIQSHKIEEYYSQKCAKEATAFMRVEELALFDLIQLFSRKNIRQILKNTCFMMYNCIINYKL